MLSLLAATSFASGPWFDACDLSYFGTAECRREAPEESPEATEEDPVPPAPKKTGSSIRELDDSPFDWEAYADPSDVRFWDDGGDWVPPRPLREVLANPTPENVAFYKAWIEKKFEVAADGQKLLWGDAPTRGVGAPVDLNQPSVVRVDWAKVQVLYFYQSSCGHCKASAPLVASLRSRGVEVIPVYLDKPDPTYGKSIPYTKALASALKVEGTPTWLVQSSGQKTVVRGKTTLDRLARVVQILEKGEGA